MVLKKHFHLACVEVTFVDSEGESGVTRVNVMITTTEGLVNVGHLGRAQQAAQMQLVEKLGDPRLTFLNAVFTSITHLGLMTDEQFNPAASNEALKQVSNDG